MLGALFANNAQAEDYRVNGVAVSVDRVTVRGTIKTLAPRLLNRWRAAGSRAVELQQAQGKLFVLGRNHRSQYQTVSLRAGPSPRQIELTSTLSSLRRKPARLPRVPLIDGAAPTMTSIVEDLGARPAITFRGRSKLSRSTLADLASRAAAATGWMRLPGAGSTPAMLWARGSQSIVLQLTPRRTGSSFVLVHLPAGSGVRE